jgi:S-adenosylmethionine synthetase
MTCLLCRPSRSHDHRTHVQIHRRYGPAPSNADSAINILVDVVRDQSGKKYTMDHYQTRFPTNVLDIASFLVRLASMNSSLLLDMPGLTREPERPKSARLPPIIHYSAEEPFTKYEICLVFARILGLPHTHIIPDAGPPPPGTGAPTLYHFLTNC